MDVSPTDVSSKTKRTSFAWKVDGQLFSSLEELHEKLAELLGKSKYIHTISVHSRRIFLFITFFVLLFGLADFFFTRGCIFIERLKSCKLTVYMHGKAFVRRLLSNYILCGRAQSLSERIRIKGFSVIKPF